ncbi:Crp/Fnr family transcriptional regulator [Cucumibacter marinus]|uniref:Crp/Fnr family transcriptional regulator n=1 Tax=Cucumibacter marinus TaxID=1121252 RepID=UPI0004260B59|nr:Crp/Fnr family transcriptional regulator [Cucumibacter marinus]
MSFASLTLFQSLAPAPLTGLEALESRIIMRSHAAGSMIFAAGDPLTSVQVVRTGLVKLCYVLADGDEWIKSFIPEGQLFTSITAHMGEGGAGFDAVALEPTEIESLPFSVLRELAANDLAWAGMLTELLLAYAARKEARERDFLTLKPEARYRTLRRTNPGLIARITQKDLAAYLGVTPVGLNRIVKRVENDFTSTA